MAASRTGGDVAGVEDIQVKAQVGEVEVHEAGSCFKCRGDWFIAIASKLAPTIWNAIPCGSELARDGVSSAKKSLSLLLEERHSQYMAHFQTETPGAR
jgi:hypothetical protein